MIAVTVTPHRRHWRLCDARECAERLATERGELMIVYRDRWIDWTSERLTERDGHSVTNYAGLVEYRVPVADIVAVYQPADRVVST